MFIIMLILIYETEDVFNDLAVVTNDEVFVLIETLFDNRMSGVLPSRILVHTDPVHTDNSKTEGPRSLLREALCMS